MKRKEKEIFTAGDATGTHTVMPHVQGNATQAPPDSNTKAITHPGQTITQFHQQSQITTTTTTTTTTQGHHQHPPVLGSNADITQQFMTFLDETRQQAKLLEYRKELLANIPIFDRKDKKACLMWLSQCAHTAVNTKMTLKEVLVAKGGPIVSTQVQIFMSKTPDATDTELKQHIPRKLLKRGIQNRGPPLLNKDDHG